MKSLPLKFLGLICLLTLIGTMLFQSRSAQFQPGTAQDSRDLVFATVGSQELRLALFIPESAKNPPLVVYIHGGGWSQGSYKSCPICWLTQEGFAVASVSYRLSNVAKFPAQIHDVKAAVRWLRAHAPDYGYDAERIAVSGSSAGAYLALMMGLTNSDGDLEGSVGDHADQSSRVDAIIDYFGPTDFVLRSKNQPRKTEYRFSSVRRLLGARASQNVELAAYASPAYKVDGAAPPLLIFHGSRDSTVYLDQSERMAEEYRKAGRDVTLEVIEGAGHGGEEFFTEKYRRVVVDFLNTHLRQADNR